MIKIQATASGTTITNQTQKTDANGNTYVQNQTYNYDLNGNPSGATQNSTTQNLSYNPATNTYAPVTAPTDSANPAAQASPSIQFPSDYARTGEAAAAAATVTAAVNALDPKLDQLHTDLTATEAGPADPVLPQSSDFQNAFFSGTFNNLLSWAPNLSGTCPTQDFNFTFFGQTFAFTLNSHCQILENNRQSVSVIMEAAWTIAALFIVLGA